MTIYGVYVTSQEYDCYGEESGYKESLVELCSSKEIANELVRKLIEDKVSEMKERVSGMKEKGLYHEHLEQIISLIEKNLVSINFTHDMDTWYEHVPLYHVRSASVITEI